MSWPTKQVTLYADHEDTTGTPMPIGEVLFTEFGISRRRKGKLISDLDIIVQLRNLDSSAEGYEVQKKALKGMLQCYSPAACLMSRASKNIIEHSRTGFLQLDFDAPGIADFDIDEVKKYVFSLPFIAYCGLSCSGRGFYALACIADPYRLEDYSVHMNEVFLSFGLRLDTSKGKNVNDLRYLSYDSNALVRDYPEVLEVKTFLKPKAEVKKYAQRLFPIGNDDRRIRSMLAQISAAQNGSRWETCRKVGYTLGGLGDRNLLERIKHQIQISAQYAGYEEHCFEGAEDGFEAGLLKPLPK